MNGIKQSDCKFYVDEVARTVICVIPDTKNMVENFIWDHFQWGDINLYTSMEYGSKFRKMIKMPNSFMGKAVCAPEDEWNEALGRKIAFARAKDKCYKSFFKRMNLFVQTVDRRLGNMIDMLNDFGLKLSEKKEKLESEIDKLFVE